jgi:hypothetical protein
VQLDCQRGVLGPCTLSLQYQGLQVRGLGFGATSVALRASLRALIREWPNQLLRLSGFGCTYLSNLAVTYLPFHTTFAMVRCTAGSQDTPMLLFCSKLA